MDIGTFVNENKFLPLRSVGSGRHETVVFSLNLARREVNVFFQLTRLNPKAVGNEPRKLINNYRIGIPFVHFSYIFKFSDEEITSLSFTLDSPPSYHRMLQDMSLTFQENENTWRSQDAWFRQTDIVQAPHELAFIPVSLRKHNPLIDIGMRKFLQHV